MKIIIFTILIEIFLSACRLAPKPKQPSQWNRIPINKTIPDEIQRGAI
ncbi:TrwH protein [Bartonella harrusi]|uniref:TrwH protein n=1 Tax=Bartonella harrusi TaxID=2961895 RepID=A0ABY5ET50_9HYPH|nr:TrwH protein [Bartonella harrusi]UTO28314.1 TrwH protein [Bartonella harrusi]